MLTVIIESNYKQNHIRLYNLLHRKKISNSIEHFWRKLNILNLINVSSGNKHLAFIYTKKKMNRTFVSFSNRAPNFDLETTRTFPDENCSYFLPHIFIFHEIWTMVIWKCTYCKLFCSFFHTCIKYIVFVIKRCWNSFFTFFACLV